MADIMSLRLDWRFWAVISIIFAALTIGIAIGSIRPYSQSPTGEEIPTTSTQRPEINKTTPLSPESDEDPQIIASSPTTVDTDVSQTGMSTDTINGNNVTVDAINTSVSEATSTKTEASTVREIDSTETPDRVTPNPTDTPVELGTDSLSTTVETNS
ncbi:hypothetical protein [Halomicrobium urmianum]|uniref:hypothetical protein n=1 Tax=Halomicrobium urmianum TaxID=1586233 RepID=UPI001CD9C570|nr:hypothetical protein [Halomicrobium urmianum]